MNLTVSELSPRDAYKLLTGIVVPRPIALVTSRDEDGLLNAAPFSFFNLIGGNPPIVVLGVGNRSADVPKDTAYNIETTREFVVNMVSRHMLNDMNSCAVDFPAEISEVKAANLPTENSRLVSVPRLATTRAALECRLHQSLTIGENRLLIGEVVALYVADHLIDAEKMHIDSPGLELIGRMGGGGGYTDTSGTFELARLSFAQWQEKNGGAPR